MKYRVWIGVKYCDAYFDFDEIGEAAVFMEQAVAHSVEGDDGAVRVSLTVISEKKEG